MGEVEKSVLVFFLMLLWSEADPTDIKVSNQPANDTGEERTREATCFTREKGQNYYK